MKKFKQIMAIAGVIIIVALYLATFILAFAAGKSETAAMLFRAALASTIMVPIFLYVIVWLRKVLAQHYQDKLQKMDTDASKKNEE